MNDLNAVVFEEEEFDIVDPIENNVPNLDNNLVTNITEDDNDLTTEVLKLKGINDPSKIKFEDESGVVIERDWNSLSKEEQLNILVGSDEENNDLDDNEVELINTIRLSGMSVEDYIKSIQAPTNNVKEYKIDSLSDEDVYALDLLEKVGSDNITDEEITAAVEAAKLNESLFKKTVEGLRKEYIRLQENEEAQLAQELALKQQLEYQLFANTILNEIKGLNLFAGRNLELSVEDMEELSSFILDLDDSGMSSFGKAMNNPTLFTKAAFWVLNENKIVEELNKQIQDSFKRGYELAKKDFPKKESSKLVIGGNKNNKTDDNFVDDDDWD